MLACPPLALPTGQGTRRYGFLNEEKVPDTVHPSLWRLARLNAINGLFEVVPGVYQVRGLALANVTLIERATGLIIVAPTGRNIWAPKELVVPPGLANSTCSTASTQGLRLSSRVDRSRDRG